MTGLRDTVAGLAVRWWVIIAGVVVGALVGLLYAVIAPTTYTADAYILVTASDPSNTSGATNFAQAYGRVLTQPDLVSRAAADVGLPVDQLLDRLRTSTSPDAPLIEVVGSAGDPFQAANIANAVVQEFVVYGNLRTGDTSMRLSSFSLASAPTRPTSPVLGLDTAVGAAAGLLLGALAAGAGVGARGIRISIVRQVRAEEAADDDERAASAGSGSPKGAMAPEQEEALEPTSAPKPTDATKPTNFEEPTKSTTPKKPEEPGTGGPVEPEAETTGPEERQAYRARSERQTGAS